MELKYYHYTPAIRIEEIVKSGQINLATASVASPKEKACAWVSTNENFEPTAIKGKMDENGVYTPLTFDEQIEVFGLARIQVRPIGLTNWGKIKHLANMNLRFAKEMENSGIKMGGNPKEWFGSLEPITRENWIKAEVYNNGEWIDYPMYIESEKEKEIREAGLRIICIVFTEVENPYTSLVLLTNDEVEYLKQIAEENMKNNIMGNGYYCMWVESNLEHDLSGIDFKERGVLSEEQFNQILKRKLDHQQANSAQ